MANTLTTYAGLKQAVQDWMGRGDTKFTGNADNHIALAEARIWRRVRMQKGKSAVTTLNVPAGLNYVALPDDFLGLSRIAAAGNGGLTYVPVERLGMDNEDGVGPDSQYSIDGPYFYLGTAPAAIYPVSIVYYKRPAPIITAATADLWLLLAAPDIYLYASLLEAAIFTKTAGGKDRVAEFGSLLDRAIEEAQSADKAGQFPRDQRLLMRRAGARMGDGVAN